MSIRSFPAFLALFLLLSGCQTYTATQQSVIPEPVTSEPEPEEIEAEVPVKPFSKEALYQLLVAELAGMRGDIELALTNYVQQARASRDPIIIERALRIATYVNAGEEQLQMAALWVEMEPEKLEARHTLALGLARNGLLMEALPHAIYCLEHDNAEPLLTLTVLANSKNKKDRQTLLDQYPSLETQYPEKSEIFLSRAMLLRQQGLPEQALEAVNQSLRLNAESETANLLAAQLLHQQGKKPDALALLEQAISARPDSKRLRIQHVRFVAVDDLAEAKASLEQLSNDFPKDADLKLTLASVNRELGLDSEAKALYQQLLNNRNAALRAHFQLGMMAEDEGALEEALLHYRKVRSGANFIPAAARVSHLLAKHNQLETARLYLSKLRTEQPQQAATLYQVESELLVELRKSQDAYQLLSNALDRFPDNISLLYSRSVVGEKLDEFAQSERDLRAILALDENNAMALNALGYTLTLHSTRYEEALQLIRRALELNPEDPATLDSLGWVLYRMGEHEAALVQLRKAFASLPDPEVAAHLGEVLWVTGSREEAERIWNEALSKNPKNEIILDTIKRLKAID